MNDHPASRRDTDQTVELLKTVPLFAGLSRRHLQAVARAAQEISVPAGEVLAEEGTEGDRFFLVVEGWVEVSRDGAQIARLGDATFFGEMSIIDGGRRSATVTSLIETSLLVIDRVAFDTLLERSPELMRELLVGVVRRLRAADRKLAEHD